MHLPRDLDEVARVGGQIGARSVAASAMNGGRITAYVLGETVKPLTLAIAPLTDEEKEIIRCGSLINYNRNKKNA